MRNVSIVPLRKALLLVAATLLFSFSVRADQQVSAKLSVAMQLNGTVNETGCNNSKGPQITLEGEIVLGGVQVELIFQNNAKGTHEASELWGTNVVLVPLGGAITLPKQPVRGGVGGNPHIWIQFHDGAGNNLTDETYLGRCVQGLSISPSFVREVIALAEVAALDCANSPGPVISIGSTLTFSGLHARFIFRNNLKGTHTAEDVRDVALIVNGSELTIPKQPVQGGAGGNPIISVQFLDGAGEELDDPITLGRCNQL
jgi:hypothetical protein